MFPSSAGDYVQPVDAIKHSKLAQDRKGVLQARCRSRRNLRVVVWVKPRPWRQSISSVIGPGSSLSLLPDHGMLIWVLFKKPSTLFKCLSAIFRNPKMRADPSYVVHCSKWTSRCIHVSASADLPQLLL
jgi:hypothetical protein